MEELRSNHQKEDLNVKKNRLPIDALSFLSLIKQSYERKYSQKIVSLQNDLCQKKGAFKLHHRNLSRNTPKKFFQFLLVTLVGGNFRILSGIYCNCIKKRLQHRFFPVNIAKFLRIPILKNTCKWLLLRYVNQVCISDATDNS